MRFGYSYYSQFIDIAEDPVAAYDIKEVSSHTPTFILKQPMTNEQKQVYE